MAAATAEADVGITEFVTQLPGFSGIVKHRYRDFQVNEVGVEGNVALLTNLLPPAEPEPLPVSQVSAAIPAAVESFAALAGQQAAERLQALLLRIAATADGSKDASTDTPAGAPVVECSAGGALSVTLEPMADKEQRKAVHNFFKGNPSLPALSTTALDAPPAAAASRPATASASGTSQPATQTDANGTSQPATQTDANGASQPASASGTSQPATQTEANGTSQPAQPAISTAKPAKPAGPQPKLGPPSIQIKWQPEGGSGGGRDGGRNGGGGRSGGGRGGGRGRGGSQEPAWGGAAGERFVKFALYKENMDTQVALSSLARALHLSARADPWGFAGTKDKRGVTTQWVTAFKVHPIKLAALNNLHWLRGVRVGSISYCKEPLQLGQLLGNRFQVLMRDLTPLHEGQEGQKPLEEQVCDACQALAERGFINYYGLQRFGTAGTPTHRVGMALLRGDFRRAVDLIMAVDPTQGAQEEAAQGQAQQEGASRGPLGSHHKPEVEAARVAWAERRDAKSASRNLPNWMVAERAVMSALAPHAPAQHRNTPKPTAAHTTAKSAQAQQPQQEHQQQEQKEQEQQQQEQQQQEEQQQPPDSSLESTLAIESDKADGVEPAAKRPRIEEGASTGADMECTPANGAGETKAADAAAAPVAAATASQAPATWPTWLTERLAAEAIGRVPRTLRLMYLHAWQSRMWNLAASHRVKVYGADRVVAGDLVMPRSRTQPTASSTTTAGTGADMSGAALLELAGVGNAGGGDDETGAAVAGAEAGPDVAGGSDPQQVAANEGGSRATRLEQVHVVSEAEARSGAYSIEDVVLPLPGARVTYPRHDTAQLYKQLCAADGVHITLPREKDEALTVDNQRTEAAGATQTDRDTIMEDAAAGKAVANGMGKAAVPGKRPAWAAPFAFSALTGDYRRLVLRPRNFTFRLLRSGHINDDSLILTGWELLQQQQQPLPPPPPLPPTPPTASAPAALDNQDTNGHQRNPDGHENVAMSASDAVPNNPRVHVGGPGGPLLSVLLDFMLPSSAYATMLIREVTRQGTSRAYQAGLTHAAQAAQDKAGL